MSKRGKNGVGLDHVMLGCGSHSASLGLIRPIIITVGLPGKTNNNTLYADQKVKKIKIGFTKTHIFRPTQNLVR